MLTIPVWFTEKVWGLVLEFLSTKASKVVDEKISSDLSKLLADKSFEKDILRALDAAANKFLMTYSDREVARYLTNDMRFYDLISVQQATKELIEHPYSLELIKTLVRDFASLLPAKEKNKASDAANYFVELLREQLISVFKAHETLELFFQFEELRIHQKHLNVSIEQLEATQQLKDYFKTSLLILRKTREDYLNYVIAQNKFIDPRGIIKTSHPISLPLEKIYVPLIAYDELEVSFASPSVDKLAEDNATQYSIENLPLAIKRYNKLVILGEPGSGKTTFLRFLSYLFASQYSHQNLANNIEVKDSAGNSYGLGGIPFYLRISKYADSLLHQPSSNLWGFLENSLREAGMSENVPRDFLDDVFRNGQAIVLLDGLDEVLDIGQRVEVGRQIEKLISAKPNNRYLITSRIVGYRNAPLAGIFAHFTLKEFGKEQIIQFLSRWCPEAEKAYNPTVTKDELDIKTRSEIEGILQAINQNIGIKRLATTPLMLTVLALAHHQKGRMPSRRVELYEFAIKVLFEDWEVARGISDRSIIKETEALRLLGPLAYWIHESKPQGLANEHEVKLKLSEIFATSQGIPLDDLAVQDAVESFLLKIQERTGVFQKTGSNYGFIHQTFEEYFCAREIARRHKDAIQRVYQHRHDSRWEEPILLAIGFMSKDYPEDAEELVQTSILANSALASELGFSPSAYEDVLHRDLLFATKCIGDAVGLSLNFSKRLVDNIIRIYFDIEGKGKYKPLRDLILSILVYIRASDVAGYVVEQFIAVTDTNNTPDYIKGYFEEARAPKKIVNTIKGETPLYKGKKKSIYDAILEAAIVGLGQIGVDTQDVISVLDDVYKSNSNLRILALKILKDFGVRRRPSAATGVLGILPGSLDESSIFPDEFKLPDMGKPEAIVSLIPSLDHPWWEIQVRVAIAIVHIHSYQTAISPEIRSKIKKILYEGLNDSEKIITIKSSKGNFIHDVIWNTLWDITGS